MQLQQPPQQPLMQRSGDTRQEQLERHFAARVEPLKEDEHQDSALVCGDRASRPPNRRRGALAALHSSNYKLCL